MRTNESLIGKSTNYNYYHWFPPRDHWWCGPANPRYAEAIDYYYVYGPSVDAIIRGYRELLDAWFWQGEEVAVPKTDGGAGTSIGSRRMIGLIRYERIRFTGPLGLVSAQDHWGCSALWKASWQTVMGGSWFHGPVVTRTATLLPCMEGGFHWPLFALRERDSLRNYPVLFPMISADLLFVRTSGDELFKLPPATYVSSWMAASFFFRGRWLGGVVFKLSLCWL